MVAIDPATVLYTVYCTVMIYRHVATTRWSTLAGPRDTAEPLDVWVNPENTNQQSAYGARIDD